MPATERAVELLTAAAEAAHDKKAENVIAFDVSEQLAITDGFLIASASNDRQVRAIVDAIEEKLREHDAKPVRREGEREGRWVLLDYLDVVIHVQHAEERVFYALERLWKDCPVIPLPEPVIVGRPGTAGSAGGVGLLGDVGVSGGLRGARGVNGAGGAGGAGPRLRDSR